MKKNRTLLIGLLGITVVIFANRCSKDVDKTAIPVYSVSLLAEMGHEYHNIDSGGTTYCTGTGICGTTSVKVPGASEIPIQFIYDGANQPDKLKLIFNLEALTTTQSDRAIEFNNPNGGSYQLVIAIPLNNPDFLPLNIPATCQYIPVNPAGTYTIDNNGDVTLIMPISPNP